MPSLITGIIGGIQGSSAAHHAANEQEQGYVNAANTVNEAVNRANPIISDTYNQGRQDISGAYNNTADLVNPYLGVGSQAAATLQDFTKPGANVTALMESLDPGYQFRLSQGTQGVAQSAAANGLLQSGAAARGITGYAQNFASNEFQNTFNRLGSLANMGNQTAQFLGSQGFRGAETTAGLGAEAAARQAGNITSAGVYGGNAQIGIGDALARGTLGAANQWNNMLTGVGDFANGVALAGLPASGGGGWSFGNVGKNLWGNG